MMRDERRQAVYLHACPNYIHGDDVNNNTTIRERFGLTDPSKASRLIADAVEGNLIRLLYPEAKRKLARYVPYWAWRWEGSSFAVQRPPSQIRGWAKRSEQVKRGDFNFVAILRFVTRTGRRLEF